MFALKRLCLLLCLAVFMTACGTPGAPQPPSLNLAKPVSDLKAVRSGDEVELTWTVPTETTDGAKFRHRGQSKICAAADQPRIEQCTPLTTMPTPKDQKTASVAVNIPSDKTAPTDYVTYAVQVDNDRGRNAGFSNQVQVPTAAMSSLNGSPLIRLTPDMLLVTATSPLAMRAPNKPWNCAGVKRAHRRRRAWWRGEYSIWRRRARPPISSFAMIRSSGK